jgi:signal transduction histidine kinase
MGMLREFSRQLWGGFGLLILVLGLSGAWGIRTTDRSAERQAAAAREYVADLVLAERLRSGVERAAAAGRGYLIAADPAFVDGAKQAEEEVHHTLGAIGERVRTADGAALVARITEAHTAYERALDRVIAQKRAGASATAVAGLFEKELIPRRRRLDAALDDLLHLKQRQLGEEFDRAHRQVVRTSILAGVVILLAMIVSGSLAWLLGRHLAQRYHHEQEALKTAERAVTARNELLGIVAHDLRSPLTAITMKAALLLKTVADPATQRGAKSIGDITMRMESLIKGLLDAASIEEGHLSLTTAPYRMADLVRETVVLFEALAAAKSIRLETRFPADDLWVTVDRERVLQVLSNLVGNAIKFVPEGGLVKIAVERDRETVRCSVMDNGSGIVPAHLAHVFDRFWKGEPGGKRGTGLGLYIAKGIVEAHGGNIWVESPLGQGASFSFVLPEARAPTVNPNATEEPSAHA